MEKKGRFRRSLEAFRRELTRPLDEPRSPRLEPLASSRPKIGLALGGGFARGMAHIGVLKAFEEAAIPIDFIAGTSVGAAIGAAYCSGVSAKELEEVACILKFNDIARFTLSRYGFWNNDRMANFLERLFKVKTFEELKVPMAVAATDFVTGDSVVFKEGLLVDAVRASCAYPGIFLPVNVNGRLLVDGLLAHPVPTTPLKEMGADRVVAVYFSSHWVGDTGPKHFMDVIGQCFSIAQARMCSLWQMNADVVLEPEVSGIAYDAFSKSPELVKAGEEAAKAQIEKIQSWLAEPQEITTVSTAKRDRLLPPIASAPAS